MSEPEPSDEPIERDDEDEPPARATETKRQLKTSGPKIVDPYGEDQSSSLLPIVVAIVAIMIPIFFCLCRL
jgi:hypothetical protein